MIRVLWLATLGLGLPALHLLMQVGLGLGAWAPDLLAVALLLLAREIRTGRAAFAGLVFGLLEDAFSILAFGANTLTMTFLGIVGARSRDLFVGESFGFFFGYLTAGVWLRQSLHWLLAGQSVRGAAGEVLLIQAPLAALYAALVGTVLLAVAGVVREPGT